MHKIESLEKASMIKKGLIEFFFKNKIEKKRNNILQHFEQLDLRKEEITNNTKVIQTDADYEYGGILNRFLV